jgi:hypothetical protein
MHQHELTLEAGWIVAVEHVERQLPTFAGASQNMAAMAVLLDTLPIPSTDGVGEVYRRLKNILDTAAAQQAESYLQHRAEAFVLTPVHPMDRGQGAAQGALEAGIASSPATASAHDRLSRPGARSEP